MPTKMGAGVMGMPLGMAIPAVARASAIGTVLQTNTTANSIDFDVPTGGSFTINTANATGNYIQFAEAVMYMGAHALSWEGSIIAVAPAGTKKSIHTNGNALDMAVNARSGGKWDMQINAVSMATVNGTGLNTDVITGLSANAGPFLYANSADGADSGSSGFCGGGSGSVTRGGQLFACGNEHATLAGQVRVKAGAVAGSFIQLNDGTYDCLKIMSTFGSLFQRGICAVPAVKTTTYTAVLGQDLIIIGNHATVAFTITLPAATGTGQILMFGNIGAAVVTIDGNAAETINGAANFTLAQNTFQTIVDYASGVWAKI